MNSFILDLKLLNEHNLIPFEFIVLLSLKNPDLFVDLDVKFESTLESLQRKGFIKIIEEEKETVIREKGKILIELVTIGSEILDKKPEVIIKKSKRVLNDEIDSFIEEYRNLWKNARAGTMGNSKSCKEKLLRFMQEYPEYSKEQIMRSARAYHRSVDDMKYLQRADYFIYKKDKFGESSRLLDFIEEKDAPDEGWTSQLS